MNNGTFMKIITKKWHQNKNKRKKMYTSGTELLVNLFKGGLRPDILDEFAENPKDISKF